MPRLVPALVLLTAATISASAAEVDLRIGYFLRSTATDFTQNNVTNPDSWDSANRVAAGVVVQPSPALTTAFLAGVRVVADFNDIGASDYHNAALHLQVGYGWLVTPMFRLEALPYVGIGYASIDTPTGSGSSSSLEVGFDIVGAVTLPSGFQFGASAGYALTRAEPDLSSGSVEIEHDGLVGSIFVGMRL